jgi:hypothetical protein
MPAPLPPILCSLALVLRHNEDLGRIGWSYQHFRTHPLSDPRFRDLSVDPRDRIPDNLVELLPRKRHWWDRIPTVPQGSPHAAVSTGGNIDIVMEPPSGEGNDFGNDERPASPQVAIEQKRSSVSHFFFIFFFIFFSFFKFSLKRNRRASLRAANQDGAEITAEPVEPAKVSKCFCLVDFI